MKTKLLASIFLLSGLTAFGGVAQASDQAAGAIIGAGTGAIIGHTIDRGDGAVVGGILGAIVGAAIADDDDYGHRRVVVRQPPRPVYTPPPVVVYETPRVRYVPQPVYVNVRPAPPVYVLERHESRRDRWDERRRDRWDDRWDRDDRGGHRGW